MSVETTNSRQRPGAQPDGRREQILAAAVRCICDKGYEGVRLRDVGKAAGVSIGLIQHHFESREELLEYAIRHASAQLAQRFVAVGHEVADPWGRIEALIDQLCSLPDIRAHGRLWLEFAGAASKHPQLQPHLTQVYQNWDSYVRQALVDGVMAGTLEPAMPADDVMAVFMAYFDGYEFDIATGLIDADIDALRRRALYLARVLFQPTEEASSEDTMGRQSPNG